MTLVLWVELVPPHSRHSRTREGGHKLRRGPTTSINERDPKARAAASTASHAPPHVSRNRVVDADRRRHDDTGIADCGRRP
jgi:hypothetical protein